MNRLFYVLLWAALPVAVCVWAVAHGQGVTIGPPTNVWAGGPSPTVNVPLGAHVTINGQELSPTRPNVPGAVLTDDVRKICRRGYSASVRPPESVTEPYKLKLIDRWQDVAALMEQRTLVLRARDYELDDKVPLCLGGKPGPDNWWLEKIDEAHAKDREEARICREVCAGRIDIHDAQRYFLSWPDGTLQ